jgi:hypothetical protein
LPKWADSVYDIDNKKPNEAIKE